MAYYYKLGNIPHKRHTQFRKPDGSLYAEQLFSTEGFSNDYSLLYHCHPPTMIIQADAPYDVTPRVAEEKMLQHRSFEESELLAPLLARSVQLPVIEADDKQPINPGQIFIGASNYHILIDSGHLALSTEEPVLHASLHEVEPMLSGGEGSMKAIRRKRGE